MRMNRRALLLSTAAGVIVAAAPAWAQKKYDQGATDTEIKLGNTTPYSGPASAYGTNGRAAAAYFRMINDRGGVNGRKINFISYDDAYSPPKTVEQVRKLVESDEVLALVQTLGTATNSAIMKYTNAKKIPQLFVATGGTKFGDPKNFPWTMGFQPNYQSEGRVYAKYILANHPAGRIAVLFQNDDYGKDVLKGLKDGLGPKTAMIIAEAPYETGDPTVDSQVVRLQASGADNLRQHRDAKVCRAGDQEGRRARLEAGAYLEQCRGFDRLGAQAGRFRKFEGHSLDGLSAGPDRQGECQ